MKLDGTGTIASYVIVHHAILPAFLDDVPYVIAQIDLDGCGNRVQISSNVIGCSSEEIKVGMRVRVAFDDVTPEVTLPKFRPERE